MLEDSKVKNGFLYRFAAINILAVMILGATFHQGWVTQIYNADVTHITTVIGVVFLLGLLFSIVKAVQINRLWNQLELDAISTQPWICRPEAVGLRISSSIQIIHHIAASLLLLGIIGTLVGIILALKSTEAFSTSSQANLVVAIVMLFQGVYVKFFCSLVGIVGHMWLMNNYSMLVSMGRRLLARMYEHA